MKTLEELREEINSIDEKIIDLLAERFCAVDSVAIEKVRTGKGVYDGDRERIILEKIRTLAKEKGLSADIAVRIFEFLFHESRRSQEAKMRGMEHF